MRVIGLFVLRIPNLCLDSSRLHRCGPPYARGCILELWKCPSVVSWGGNAGAQKSGSGFTRCHEARCNGRAVLRFVTTTVLLSGCAVGPEFRAPPSPAVTSLSPTPASFARPGNVEQQVYVQGLDIPRRW